MFKANDIRPDDLVKIQWKYIKEDIDFLQAKKQSFANVNCPACNTPPPCQPEEIFKKWI
ncbi:hypothetical protein FACS1894140_4320 [Spirochaetia bacterium]|nr:hypothetical protein FACS1894140_4320 [Spirochaetia bacterium]